MSAQSSLSLLLACDAILHPLLRAAWHSIAAVAVLAASSGCAATQTATTMSTAVAAIRGSGDLALIVERAAGSVLIVDTTAMQPLCRVSELGDLSHASVVFSRDARYAFVFGRDGGLSKVDMLGCTLAARIIQAGNTIGGAISQDGRLVAVSNYDPGGVRVFRSRDLSPVTTIATTRIDGKGSKVVGLVDAPGMRFVFSLFDSGEIWLLDMRDTAHPSLTKFANAGKQPYDGLITPDGRHYIAGLFGEDGIAHLDLWHPERGVRKVLPDYGRGDARLPVYKMPHLEGWAAAGSKLFLPGVGRHEVWVVDAATWAVTTRIPVRGQPVFAMARPDGREVWVNFALPDNHIVQIIDTETLAVVDTLEPGPGVLHMEFTPRGEAVWVSVRDAGEVHVYDTATRKRLATLKADTPSGIFMSNRAGRIGL